ncbi:MAG: hypothetical protein MI810_13565 [Flavobacteriales bacterium]|nr:hypothetical protein [Flavobacteriales bacterium]
MPQKRIISKRQIAALFYVFAALDAATFILNFNWFFPPSFMLMVERPFYLMVILFIFSLPLSGYLFVQQKKIAVYFYYIHFPIRLITGFFSFSFVLEIDSSQLGVGAVYTNLVYLFLFLECLRLLATVYLHRQLRKPSISEKLPGEDILDL